MLSLKPGAKVAGLKPEILFALLVVEKVYGKYGVEVVVTEVTGGKHKIGSLHYKGLAIDLRSKTIHPENLQFVVGDLKDALGTDYQVFLEDEGTSNEHLHIEFDPR